MGSATREATAAAKAALAAQRSVDLQVAEDLFAAGRVVGRSAQLRSALTDPDADPTRTRGLVNGVFGGRIGPVALELLGGIAASRWSSADDLLQGIEELGLRAAARSAGATPVESELFEFGRIITSNAELELALGSKLSPTASKVALADRLLTGNASPQAAAIVRHLVEQPRGRRIGELLRGAAAIVADERGYAVATVTSAGPLTAAQLQRLERQLAGQYGRDVRFNLVIDPSLVGGLRIQIGDDVIDGSVSARLTDLRQKLAG